MKPDVDRSWLVDMLVACRRIVARTAGMTLQGYECDEDARDVVERRLIVIGEAARQLSRSFTSGHPEQPWPEITSLRHVVVHGYRKVDVAETWGVATVDVPILLQWLEAELGEDAHASHDGDP